MISWQKLAVLLVASGAIALCSGCRGAGPSETDSAQREVKAHPRSAEAHLRLANAYATKEQYNEAYIHCRQAWELDQQSFEATYELARTCLRLNDPDTGQAWIDKALKIRPDSAAAHEMKGRLAMTAGDADKSIPHFKRALELDPQLAVAQLNSVTAYKLAGNKQAAVEAAARAVQLVPDQGSAHFAYGDVLEVMGQYDEAEREYRRAIELQTDFAAAQLRLARLLTHQKRNLNEARELAREAHRLEPGDGTAEATAAWALFLMGEERDALRELQHAAQAHPFNSLIWRRFATALREAGYPEQANQAAAIALRVGSRPARPQPATNR